MEIYLKIRGDVLSREESFSAKTGNVNTYFLKFDIETEFDGLSWFCIFKTNKTALIQPIIENECFIPKEVLVKKGPVHIGCYATSENSEFRRISTNWITVQIEEGAYCEGTAPAIPEPDLWERLIGKTVPYIGENGNWFLYDIEKGEYVDSGESSHGVLTEEQISNISAAPGKVDKEDGYGLSNIKSFVATQTENEITQTIEFQDGEKVSSTLYTKKGTDALFDRAYPQYDFDETYIITEEEVTASSWGRTVDSGGNPIRLSEMQVDFTIPAGKNTGVQYLYFYYEDPDSISGTEKTSMRVSEFAYQHETKERYIRAICYKERNSFYSVRGYAWNDNDNYTGMQSTSGARMGIGRFLENPAPLRGLYFNVANGMPAAGTVVRIRGKKVNENQ